MSCVSSYAASLMEPAVPRGVHRVAQFGMLQVESQVAAQRAKRRGGPKKVWLAFHVLDERGTVLARETLVWKTITQKNFSNRENIQQYERAPFGSLAVRPAALPHPTMVMHVAGARIGNKVSNAVGVNVYGKQLESHPRFLLSSGKGDEGARSYFTFYHSNPRARIQLCGLWIECKELKVTFEQDESAEPLLEFSPKWKTVYAAKEAKLTADTDVAMTPAPRAAATAPVMRSAPAAAPPSSSTLASKRKSALRALPPSTPPAALLERLTRKRSAETLDSPVAPEHPEELPQLPVGVESQDELPPSGAPQFKKLFSESAPTHTTYAHFSGFESFEQTQAAIPSLTHSSSSGGSSDMDMEVVLSDEVSVNQQELDEATPARDDDALTPRLHDATPPPFLHESSGLTTASDSSQSSDDDDEAATQDYMKAVLDQAEEAEDRYLPRDLSPVNPFPFESEMQTKLEPPQPAVPFELATAQAKNNSFGFTAYSTPSPPDVAMLPSAMSLGEELMRSPFKLDAASSPCLSPQMQPQLSPYVSPFGDLMSLCRRVPSNGALSPHKGATPTTLPPPHGAMQPSVHGAASRPLPIPPSASRSGPPLWLSTAATPTAPPPPILTHAPEAQTPRESGSSNF